MTLIDGHQSSLIAMLNGQTRSANTLTAATASFSSSSADTTEYPDPIELAPETQTASSSPIVQSRLASTPKGPLTGSRSRNLILIIIFKK